MKNTKLILVGFLGFILILVFANYQLNNKQVGQSQNQLSQPQKISYKNIDSIKLNEMLLQKDFFLVNVHIPYEGEIEKTDVFIPYNEIENNLGKLPKDKSAKIVLYCRSGRMSKTAAETLTSLGYSNVYNLVGGMHDWQSKGYKILGDF